MYPRYTKALTALALTSAIAVPAIAQARGGSDDPPHHEQRQHQVRNQLRHGRVDKDRGERRDHVDNERVERRHDRPSNDRREHRHDRRDNDRRDGRGSDDGSSDR
jgi:hypothetical protein